MATQKTTQKIHSPRLGKINVLHCPLNIIDESLVADAHKRGLEVHAADCNTEEDLQRAIELGVDQFSTNELELALSQTLQ